MAPPASVQLGGLPRVPAASHAREIFSKTSPEQPPALHVQRVLGRTGRLEPPQPHSACVHRVRPGWNVQAAIPPRLTRCKWNAKAALLVPPVRTAARVSTARQGASQRPSEVSTLDRLQLAVRCVNPDISVRTRQPTVLRVTPEVSQFSPTAVSQALLGQAAVYGVGRADSAALQLPSALSVVLGP